MIRNWLEALAVPGDLPVRPAGRRAGRPGHRSARDDPGLDDAGLHGTRAGDDPLAAMVALLDEAGYPSIVATNCDQSLPRPVKLGERLAVSARLVDVVGPKRTALGEGWFVTTRSTWTSDGEPVAAMDFRVLKFRPSPPMTPQGRPTPPASPGSIRPVTSPDTEFFWAGTAAGELRVQRCAAAGAAPSARPDVPVLRHPELAAPGYVVAAGTGEVYSYVVHHHPPVPGQSCPS